MRYRVSVTLEAAAHATHLLLVSEQNCKGDGKRPDGDGDSQKHLATLPHHIHNGIHGAAEAVCAQEVCKLGPEHQRLHRDGDGQGVATMVGEQGIS